MIRYEKHKDLSAQHLSQLFISSGIKRPYEDLERLQKMIDHSDIIISAWDDQKLVGIARAITDYAYCCYLSDLAVNHDYQRLGIGKEMLEQLRVMLGPEVSLVLLSAPTALNYYAKLGFTNTDKGFVIARER